MRLALSKEKKRQHARYEGKASRDEAPMEVPVSKKALIPDFRMPRPPQKPAQTPQAPPRHSPFRATISHLATAAAFLILPYDSKPSLRSS